MITTYKVNGKVGSYNEIKTDEDLRLFILHELEKKLMGNGMLTIEDEGLIEHYLGTDIEFDENIEVWLEGGILYVDDTWVLK